MEQTLSTGLSTLGLSADPPVLRLFSDYSRLLLETNQVMNLTAITDPDQVAKLHFLDSLSLFSAWPLHDSRMLDVGSGAGFPGLPLRLMEPSISLTLLDSTGKRVSFLSELCSQLGVTDVTCIHGRAEELSSSPEYRETFDICVSRAVAELNVLCELCLPFVRVGGVFLAMKAAGSDGEISGAASAVRILGGELLPHFDYTVPGTEILHRVVRIRKSFPAPKGYPRRFSAIKKAPL